MEIRGYKRIKKKDIKRWFKGSNLVLYVLILLLLFALIMFAYRTIAGMHNHNIDNELNNQTEDLDNESSLQEETSTYVAKNQSYRIRINVSKNIAVISTVDGTSENGRTIKAFHIAVNKNIKRSIKQLVIPNMYFEDIGFTYLGPVDGHNIEELEKIL